MDDPDVVIVPFPEAAAVPAAGPAAVAALLALWLVEVAFEAARQAKAVESNATAVPEPSE